MNRKKNKKQVKTAWWIVFRYLLPVFAVLLMVVTLFIPCLRYTTAAQGTNEAISTAELIDNSWNQARVYLFGGGETVEEYASLLQAIFITLIVTCLLFTLGAVATVWIAVGAIRYIFAPEEWGTGRILYITLFPNRIVTVVLEALTLPLLAFPRLVVLFYDKLMNYTVLLNVTFLDPLVIGLILFGVTAAVTAATSFAEKRTGLDPFKKRELKLKKAELPDEEEPEEESPVFKTEAERQYAEMNRRAKEEQAERIARLLRKEPDEEEREHVEDEGSPDGNKNNGDQRYT